MRHPHADLIKECLEYAPNIGGSCLQWKIDRGQRGRIGKPAGWKTNKGYFEVQLGGAVTQAHRIIWFLCTGEWPKDQIDHIDRDKGNNRIENLRECTNAENMQNKGAYKTNKSGYPGVRKRKDSNRWEASLKINGVTTYLGIFKTPEEAHSAYLEAKQQHHPFHGETGKLKSAEVIE